MAGWGCFLKQTQTSLRSSLWEGHFRNNVTLHCQFKNHFWSMFMIIVLLEQTVEFMFQQSSPWPVDVIGFGDSPSILLHNLFSTLYQYHNMMIPRPCSTVGKVFLGLQAPSWLLQPYFMANLSAAWRICFQSRNFLVNTLSDYNTINLCSNSFQFRLYVFFFFGCSWISWPISSPS